MKCILIKIVKTTNEIKSKVNIEKKVKIIWGVNDLSILIENPIHKSLIKYFVNWFNLIGLT